MWIFIMIFKYIKRLLVLIIFDGTRLKKKEYFSKLSKFIYDKNMHFPRRH